MTTRLHDAGPNRQPKLLLVTTAAVTLRAFLLPLVRHLRAQGWVVDALAAGAKSCDQCVSTFDTCTNAPWSRSVFDVRRILASVRLVRDVVVSGSYDIVHVHTPIAAFVTRFALRASRSSTRVIYTAHGFHFHPSGHWAANFLFKQAERIAGKWTDFLVVINRDDYGAAQQLNLVRGSALRQLAGVGVDLEVYSQMRIDKGEMAATREALEMSEGDKLFLMVAEFNPGKRHRDAVEALALSRHDAFHLAFAGVGPELERVRSQAARLGVSDRVHFLGFREDIPRLLRACVALLLPSEREGLPRSVMEAMAMGVPTIGADVRGIRDLLGSGAGVLVPVGEVSRLASAMVELGENPALAHAIGQRARAEITQYSLTDVIRAHEELYLEALAERGSCSP